MPRGAAPVRSAWDTSGQLTVLVVDTPEVEMVTDLIDALKGAGRSLAAADNQRPVLHRRLMSRGVEPVTGVLRGLGAGDCGRVSVSVHDRVNHANQVTYRRHRRRD